MRHPLLCIPILATSVIALGAAGVDDAGVDSDAAVFSAPVRLMAGGEYVKTEAPGYAAPCWTDFNGDEHGDLVVGQFADGKMKVYLGSDEGLQAGEWLRADGEIAEVPGVW